MKFPVAMAPVLHRSRRIAGPRSAVAALLLFGVTAITPGRLFATQEEALKQAPALQTLMQLPRSYDASPLPKYKGDFIALGADGVWHKAADAKGVVYGSAAKGKKSEKSREVEPDCSPDAIVHYALQAPDSFRYEKSGLLYGVKTHTPATRLTTRYWDMPGFNSCALVVYAILKEAGCRWARYTANAKAIYDMAYRAGWEPTGTQRPGCIVAWNSRWEGDRARIGSLQKQVKAGSTAFRHVGITTGSWMAVDNSSWRSRPTRFLTYRPVMYEAPFFLCPPSRS
jgi:hypothetical protein